MTLGETLSLKTPQSEPTLICGDFNHPTVSWTEHGYAFRGDQSKSSPASAKFISDVGNLNLIQKVREPTFTCKRGDSILDLIFTDNDQRIKSIEHGEPLEFHLQGHHILNFKYLVSSGLSKSIKLIANQRITLEKVIIRVYLVTLMNFKTNGFVHLRPWISISVSSYL